MLVLLWEKRIVNVDKCVPDLYILVTYSAICCTMHAAGFREVCHDKVVFADIRFCSRGCKDWSWSLRENMFVADLLEARAFRYTGGSSQWSFMAGRHAGFIYVLGNLSNF